LFAYLWVAYKSIMTLAEFNNLDIEQRCDAVWEWGFYLGKCRELGVNKVLYAFNDYFVEMHLQISDLKIIDTVALTKDQLPPGNTYQIDKNNPFVRSSGIASGL